VKIFSGTHSRQNLAAPGSILSPKTIGQSAAIFRIYFSYVAMVYFSG
jgi:hypothetical protein